MSRFSKREFPRLTASNHRVTSPPDVNYNCIAWAATDTEHWWQPGRYWPMATPRDDFGIGVLEQAFRELGYEDCGIDDRLETGFEKVALYGSAVFYTHAAKQTVGGKWSSKLGKAEDIEHNTPDDVAGGVYGEVVEVLRRRVGRTSLLPE
jgi:hypothetical protein